MPTPLQISDARDRGLVRIADAMLSPLRWMPRAAVHEPVRRVLLMRLERIGDLLMVLDAIHDARAAWPEAAIDLAVGSWNAPLAALLPGLGRVHVADVPWLARGGPGDSWAALVAKATEWRRRRYDVVVNFEPDIRTNALAWLTGARARIGYASGGGGAFLTDASMYAPRSHVSTNARRLIATAAERPVAESAETPWPRLHLPADARARARALLSGAPRPLVGVHASGGRESKQWHLDRFAAAASEVARARQGAIVLTGGATDRALVDRVKHGLSGLPVVDLCGALDLVALAAVLEALDVMITGDTGPMHLAAAMGTPIVALFGPSNPARYGPLARRSRILRVDLPCSPCGQVRLPPERCRGHVPECLDRIGADSVVAATFEMLDAS